MEITIIKNIIILFFFAMKISDFFLEISRDFMVWMSNEKAQFYTVLSEVKEHSCILLFVRKHLRLSGWCTSLQHLSLKFGNKETAQILACRRR